MDSRQQADALHRSGITAFQAGHSPEAVDLIRRAIQLDSNRADFHSNLGLILSDSDREAAIEEFRRAVALQPNLVEAQKNLGEMLIWSGSLVEAIEPLGKALELGADVAEKTSALAMALRHTGRLEESLRCYDRILAAHPNDAGIAAERLYLLQLLPRFDSSAILREHLAWNDRFAAPLKKEIRSHQNDPDPKRRLRIGYVSPDFKNHCQRLFTLPLFSRHDHGNFEIFCYSSVTEPDEVTNHLRASADQWRHVTGQSDEQVAQTIREDRIDILVDLTMHMPHGRPLLFARKPAPVQIAWLAYPGTTGIEAIDYRLTDPYLDPPGETDADYREKSIRLPHTFWCRDFGPGTPDVGELPALKNGFITFGCLNNFCKVSDAALRLWSKVLAELPTSRLILFLDNEPRQSQLPAELGIDPSRIEFVPLQGYHDYLRTYHRIDIGLDTLPYNGHTTSLDSFWMGVPVVTMVGKTVVGRAGWSQLNNLELPELAARREADFVRIAIELAADVPRLSELRRGLRQRLQTSPLMDAAGFARDLESVYRRLWQDWVRTHACA
jgi:protein O-GlcNAc transferase